MNSCMEGPEKVLIQCLRFKDFVQHKSLVFCFSAILINSLK